MQDCYTAIISQTLLSHYKDKPVPILSGGRYPCLVPPIPPYKIRKQSRTFSRKIKSPHHGLNFILINKTTILLHKYLKINLCVLFCQLTISRSCTFHGVCTFFHLPVNFVLVNNRVISLLSNYRKEMENNFAGKRSMECKQNKGVQCEIKSNTGKSTRQGNLRHPWVRF